MIGGVYCQKQQLARRLQKADRVSLDLPVSTVLEERLSGNLRPESGDGPEVQLDQTGLARVAEVMMVLPLVRRCGFLSCLEPQTDQSRFGPGKMLRQDEQVDIAGGSTKRFVVETRCE